MKGRGLKSGWGSVKSRAARLAALSSLELSMALAMAVALGVALTVAACVGAGPPTAFLAPGVAVPLPKPIGLGYNWRASQLLSIQSHGKSFQMPAEVEVHGGQLTLVGLSAFGTRFWTVRYDGLRIEEERSSALVGLPPPEQVLADVMLVYWPPEAWSAVLPEGWALEDSPAERRLYDAGKRLVVEIQTVKGIPGKAGMGQASEGASEVTIINHVFGYSLRIQTYMSERS